MSYRKISRIKNGQVLTIRGVKYTVFELHDYYIRTFYRNSYGNMREQCFSIGDLVVAGFEPSFLGEDKNDILKRRKNFEIENKVLKNVV